MRYEANVDHQVLATSLTLSENCYTDSLPLTTELFFKNAEFAIDSGAFSLACIILTRRHLGERADFDGRNVGIEFARAMHVVCSRLLGVEPVKGADRTPSTPEVDIACAPARLGPLKIDVADGLPLVRVDWSGDTVDRNRRNSQGFAYGRYFTNAGLIADDTSVSIAIGLMHGGMRCRRLFVAATPDVEAGGYADIAAALHVVGIQLVLVPISDSAEFLVA